MNLNPSDRVDATIARLVSTYDLAPAARTQLRALLTALAADEHAPTTVRDPSDAVGVHLADSLVALE
ncbi:MAG: hypothetical protein WBD40_03405, partial [Tepidisphaeraceae bacterium]